MAADCSGDEGSSYQQRHLAGFEAAKMQVTGSALVVLAVFGSRLIDAADLYRLVDVAVAELEGSGLVMQVEQA